MSYNINIFDYIQPSSIAEGIYYSYCYDFGLPLDGGSLPFDYVEGYDMVLYDEKSGLNRKYGGELGFIQLLDGNIWLLHDIAKKVGFKPTDEQMKQDFFIDLMYPKTTGRKYNISFFDGGAFYKDEVTVIKQLLGSEEGAKVQLNYLSSALFGGVYKSYTSKIYVYMGDTDYYSKVLLSSVLLDNPGIVEYAPYNLKNIEETLEYINSIDSLVFNKVTTIYDYLKGDK